jgi:glycosyltransferase involved in cell wall biosynthesis
MSSVSVVIPGRNCAGTIRACLHAIGNIAKQSESPITEVLFVDDGSTDNSAVIAAEEGAQVLTGPGKGAGAARNRGWRAAKGDLIWFVDSDCVASGSALDALLPHLGDHAVGAVGGAYDNGCPDSLVACLIHEEIAVRHRAMPPEVDFLASFNVMYRRGVLETLDGFDERYLRGQDAELAFRTVDAGHRLRFEYTSRVAHFHERNLLAYFRAQFLQGYWRALLHFEHRGRTTGDSYSRFSDHLQPPVALLVLASSPMLAFPALAWLPLALLTALSLLQAPMMLCLRKRAGLRIAASFAVMSALRAFWRGVGLARGTIAQVLNRNRSRSS